jgi:hypothetical protein
MGVRKGHEGVFQHARSFLAHFPLPSQTTGFSQQNVCQNPRQNQNAKTEADKTE